MHSVQLLLKLRISKFFARAAAVFVAVLLSQYVTPGIVESAAADLSAASAAEGRRRPRCATAQRTCLGLVVHMVHEGSAPVVTPAWLASRIADANRLFSPVGVEFTIQEKRKELPRFANIQSRSQRDALGHNELGKKKTSPGAIHLFVVRRLADVDIANTVIRGVHWRDQDRSGARWIILSSIAPPLVLAHELGHYFGLPHSKDGRSIMNKQKGGGRPAWSSRTFLKPEHQAMRLQRDKMLRSRWLLPIGS